MSKLQRDGGGDSLPASVCVCVCVFVHLAGYHNVPAVAAVLALVIEQILRRNLYEVDSANTRVRC